MREIVFRGRCTQINKWVYGDLIHYYDRATIKDVCEYWVTPETVGQYTGLTDKNGKKIFEGDIIKDRDNELHIVKIGEYYPDHYLRLCCHLLEPVKLCNLYGVYAEIINGEHKGDCFVIPPKNGVEAIGNIHDNPELLKGGVADA